MSYEESGSLSTNRISPQDETIEIDTWDNTTLENLVNDNGIIRLPEVSTIPDSAIHRWTLEEDSSTFEDSIGSDDATDSGTTRVTDTWYGGAARDSGGTGHIESTTWGTFGSSMDSDFAVALTIQSTNIALEDRFLGVVNDNTTTVFTVEYAETSASSTVEGMRLFLRDSDGNTYRVGSDVQPTDGTKHRVVINKTANTGDGVTVYDDTTAASNHVVGVDEGFTNPGDFDYPVSIFGWNNRGSVLDIPDSVIDDVVIYGSSLTSDEIQQDYDAQPWTGDSGNDTGGSYFASNGIGEPTYSTNQPAAVYDSSVDTTFVTYQGTDLNPYATAYDHSSGSWEPNTQAGSKPLVDDNHGVPAICVDDDGYLHIFYGCHNDPIQYSRSTNPHDPTDWTEMSALYDEATYTKPVVVDGTIYLFYRWGDTQSHRPERVITSSDNGDTWNSPADVIDFPDRSLYTGDVWPDGTDIHIVWGHAPNPQLERYDVYHAIYDTTDDTVKTMDGTNHGSTLTRSEADNYALVYDSGDVVTIVPRVRIDSNGHPHIIWNRNTGSSTSGKWTYEYCRWDGSGWTTPQAITTSTDNSDGPAMVLKSANDIRAHLSTDADGDGLLDIEEWQFDGSSWSKVETILSGSDYGKDLDTPSTPMPYTDEIDLLFSENAGDFSTQLKLFAHGMNGFAKK